MAVETITLFGTQAMGKPVGRCIYCGSDGGEQGLSDEHIVAFCLASDTYLPSASCASCAKKTSYLEGYAGRHVFGRYRQHAGIQSRRKKIELGSAPVVFQTIRGEETRQIPRDSLPAIVTLPIWEPPGLFTDGVCTPIERCQGWIWTADGRDEMMKPLMQEGDLSWRIPTSIRTLVFARMLAKIAHAQAVGLLGVDSFKPYLPPLILSEDDNASLLIGGAAPPTEAHPATPWREDTHHHTIELTMMSAQGKPDIIVTRIRLFLHLGSPTYWVIVGEALPAARARLLEPDGGQAP